MSSSWLALLVVGLVVVVGGSVVIVVILHVDYVVDVLSLMLSSFCLCVVLVWHRVLCFLLFVCSCYCCCSRCFYG